MEENELSTKVVDVLIFLLLFLLKFETKIVNGFFVH